MATPKAKKARKPTRYVQLEHYEGKCPTLKVHTPYGVASKILTRGEVAWLIQALAPYLETGRTR